MIAAHSELNDFVVELHLGQDLFEDVRAHIEDETRGEEAGFLICGVRKRGKDLVLLARDWWPVPEESVVSRGGRDGYELAWEPEFNAAVLAAADREHASVVLVHAHVGSRFARLSKADLRNARALLPAFSRILKTPCGSVVIGQQSAAGAFWDGGESFGRFSQLRIVGAPLEGIFDANVRTLEPNPRRRLSRQNAA